jgi:hypothetical protein
VPSVLGECRARWSVLDAPLTKCCSHAQDDGTGLGAVRPLLRSRAVLPPQHHPSQRAGPQQHAWCVWVMCWCRSLTFR